MIGDARLSGEECALTDVCRAGDAHLRNEDCAGFDARIVSKLHQVVQTRVGADLGVPQRAPVDGAQRPNVSSRSDADTAHLGDGFAPAFSVWVQVAKPPLSQHGSRADLYPIAQEGAAEQAYAGADAAGLAYDHPFFDGALGAEAAVLADLRRAFDDTERTDRSRGGDSGIAVYDSAGVDSRTNHTFGMEGPKQLHEGSRWIRHSEERRAGGGKLKSEVLAAYHQSRP